MTVKSNNPRCSEWHPVLPDQCELDAGHPDAHRVVDPVFNHFWLEDRMWRESRSDAGREPDEDYTGQGEQ